MTDRDDQHGPFRWGVLGTGNIAGQFCRDLNGLSGHELSAVASRSADRAADFCREHGGTAVGGYDDLLDDPGLDGVYVSLPNALHAEWTRKALRAGHHVLCEKPLATSVAEAEGMFDAARKADRLLVEAFMWRCQPQTRRMLQAIREGEIGTVKTIRASFCYRTTKFDGNVRFDPELAGGALMDVGCYCLDAILLFGGGGVSSVSAEARRHDRGVDAATSGVVTLDNGVHATFTCALDTQLDNTLIIGGTGGYLTATIPWKPGEGAGFTVKQAARPKQELKAGETAGPPPERFFETPPTMPLYAAEAEAFANAVRGMAEPFMTRDDSLALARLLDRARSSAASSGTSQA